MKKRDVFWGIFFVLAAILILVVRIAEYPLNAVLGISFWELICTVLLIALIVKSIFERSIFGALFSAALIAIIFDNQLGITAITPWYLLGATALASIGLEMIFRPKRRQYNKQNNWNWNFTNSAGYGSPNGNEQSFDREGAQNVTGSQTWFRTTFGESLKYVKTEDFRSCSISNTFGQTKVFFDGCTIQPGVEPYIDVASSFGEIQLYIPRSWRVSIEARATFGSIEEKNNFGAVESPVVHLRGSVSFGDLEIFYV